MDFQLTEEQLSVQKWVHQFAEDEIRPVIEAWASGRTRVEACAALSDDWQGLLVSDGSGG